MANLQEGLNSKETVNRELRVMNFAIHTSRKMTTLKMYYGEKLGTVITETLITAPALSSVWKDMCFSEGSAKVPNHAMRDGKGNLTDNIVLANKTEKLMKQTKPGTILKIEEKFRKEEELPY